MRRLARKHAIVTGAATGIGRAIAVRFAQEGATVAINYIGDPNPALATLEEVRQARGEPGADMIVEADVTSERDVLKMFSQVIERLGRIDILVNNAGVQKAIPTEHLELDEFDRVLNVNLRGAFLCAREAIRHFLTRPGGGVILNNSSVHAIIPKPKYLPYSLSKGAICNFTRTLALEYAGRGIRVNAVGPGAVVTAINQPWVDDPVKHEVVKSHIPMGRAAQPEEIAPVFAFLASDEASYITGQTLFACGGLTLYPEFRSAWASGE